MVAAITPTSTPIESLLWSRSLEREHGFEPLRVEGTLPAELRGTLVRNGPGLFGQFGTAYGHPFEADGAATAIRIADGAATGASRVHQTAGLTDERAAGKILYGFDAPLSRRLRNAVRGKRKNTANTNVMMWQGRLFALMEGARPTEIDPRDLSTIGETSLGEVVGPMFSAHPHRVASRNASYNFGLEYGRVTKIGMYELPDAGPARKLGTVELAGPPMLHDFIATDSHLVFFVSPVRLDVPRMLLQRGPFAKLWNWAPSHGVDVIVVPIDRPTEIVRFTTDAFYQWHFANAFETNGSIVVDYIRYPDFDTFYEIGGAGTGAFTALADGRYHRATIDLAAKTLRSEQLIERRCEFPTLIPGTEGRAHATTFVAFDDLRAIGAIDIARGTIVAHELPADERASEPLYANGHVLALCHAPGRAYVAVYDAARIPDGPVAKIHVDHHIPITFHGLFAPAA